MCLKIQLAVPSTLLRLVILTLRKCGFEHEPVWPRRPPPFMKRHLPFETSATRRRMLRMRPDVRLPVLQLNSIELPLSTIIADGTVDGVAAADAERAHTCVAAIAELHTLAQREDVRDVFFAALDSSEYLGILDEQSGPARLQTGANLNKFGELLEDFADWSDDRRVSRALHYLSILRDSREAGELAPIAAIEDGVVLLTAHGAKGLEWPHVFIARCTRDRWSGRGQSPSAIQLPDELVPEPPPPGDAAIDEERRLFASLAVFAGDVAGT